jgi:tRNA (guanine9-N1)-methyltransferase
MRICAAPFIIINHTFYPIPIPAKTEKERKSLLQQLMYCYASNKKSSRPFRLVIAGSDQMSNDLANKFGGPEIVKQWQSFGFFLLRTMSLQDFCLQLRQAGKAEVYYLSAESSDLVPDDLFAPSSGKAHRMNDVAPTTSVCYIIGGIVDRNRLKGASMAKAAEIGVETRRLPLDKYIDFSKSSRVITVNHVFDIMINFHSNRDAASSVEAKWSAAILDALPQRKQLGDHVLTAS